MANRGDTRDRRVQLVATMERILRRRNIAPYALAQLDQLLSVLGVAAITGSPVITVAVVVAVTAAIVATFAAPVRVAAGFAVATSAPGVAAAFVLRSRSGGNIGEDLAAFVLILLLIALASFILGFLTIQARQLRSELSSRPVRGQPAAIGLGLAVSRTLAELMGGSLAYRHDGDWSVFELSLPAPVDA